jgi:1,4-alpha-glucan branching enzyme
MKRQVKIDIDSDDWNEIATLMEMLAREVRERKTHTMTGKSIGFEYRFELVDQDGNNLYRADWV